MSAATVRDEPLASWVAAHTGELRAHLRRFVDPDDAEDLLQSVWIAAHRSPPAGDGTANVRAWLYRVATNAALDRLSRDRRRRELLEREGHRLEAEPVASTDSGLVSEEVRVQVRAAIARLPRKQREAVWLRWADGLGYEEIGRRLACSPESARANVYQGMKRLRRTLAELLREETT